mgnify:CR=1 FL=1
MCAVRLRKQRGCGIRRIRHTVMAVSRTTEKENAAEAVLLKGSKIIFLKTGTIFIVPVLLFWLIHRNVAYQVVLKFLTLYTSNDIRPPVFERR